MSESLMGGMPQNDCPLLDAMERRCRGIDILSGDLHQNLLETCGVHQLCYLCVSSIKLSLTIFLNLNNFFDIFDFFFL